MFGWLKRAIFGSEEPEHREQPAKATKPASARSKKRTAPSTGAGPSPKKIKTLPTDWDRQFVQVKNFIDTVGPINQIEAKKYPAMAAWIARQKQAFANTHNGLQGENLSAGQIRLLQQAGVLEDDTAKEIPPKAAPLIATPVAAATVTGHRKVASPKVAKAAVAAPPEAAPTTSPFDPVTPSPGRALNGWYDFDVMYDRAALYYKRHGNSEIPGDLPEDPDLARWAQLVRQRYRKMLRGGTTRLSRAQVAKLQAINFPALLKRGRKSGKSKN